MALESKSLFHPEASRQQARSFNLPLPALVAAVVGFTLADAYSWEPQTLAAPEAARLAGPWAAAQALNAEGLGAAPLDKTEAILDDVTLKLPSKKWRDQILRVWRVDPLRCPVCQGPLLATATLPGANTARNSARLAC